MNIKSEKIQLSIEIDEGIYNCIQRFIVDNPQWSRERLINASMSLFLMQNYRNMNPDDYRICSKKYLHSVCQ